MENSFDAAANFLREYKQNAVLVANPLDDHALISTLPTLWKPILEADGVERVAVTIQAWRNTFGSVFSLLIQALEKQLTDVFILKRPEGYSLLYVVVGDDDVYYYEGGNPNDFQVDKRIEPFWPNLPEYIKQFYATLHDGWYFLSAHSLGLLPSREIKLLQDDEWGILDDIKITFDLSKTAPFFYNGASGYLCFNFEESEPVGILWWSDEAPTVGIRFEDFFDEWATIGMEN